MVATPDYVLRLREKIGRDYLLLPGVTAVVLRPGEPAPSVLLVRRADNGAWAPVTGIVDPEEQPHDAAVREVLEETGLHVRVEALLGAGATARTSYPNGDEVSFVELAYRLSLVDEAEVPRVADEESLEVRWFSAFELPGLAPRFRMSCADAIAQARHPEGFRPRIGFRKRHR